MKTVIDKDLRIVKTVPTEDPNTRVVIFGIGATDPRNTPELYCIGTISLRSGYVSFFDAETNATQAAREYNVAHRRFGNHGRQGPIF